MYILCISPFLLARQFIQIYFKRIVDERKPKLRRWRIEYPFAFHYKTMRTNRSFSSLSLTSAGNTLQIAFFFVIIPFLESSITRIVSVKLVKHFSNRRRGAHTHGRTSPLSRLVSEKEKWGDVDLLLGMIQAVKYISYRGRVSKNRVED